MSSPQTTALTFADVEGKNYVEQIAAVQASMTPEEMTEAIAGLADYDANDTLASTSGFAMTPATLKAWAALGEALARQTGREVIAGDKYGGTSWVARKAQADLEHSAALRKLDKLRKEARESN